MENEKHLSIGTIAGIGALVILLLFVLSVVAYFVFPSPNPDLGIDDIYASQQLGRAKVYIRCSGYCKVSIDYAEIGQTAVLGDSSYPINDDLGKYIVRVHFASVDATKRFEKKYSDWTTSPLGNRGLSFMYVPWASGDCDTAIYIGSNEPIELDDIVIIGFES